ncbi:MAG: FUSC family protein [Acidimicrobiia bacterium]|nr:FUSC family protein [Acidimicrobiia bacterium]
MARQAWTALVHRTGWTPPTRAEVATVAKAALAAAAAWALAVAVTGVSDPVLAPLAALICVRVSADASVRVALQRSAAVVLGVLLAVAIGDAIGLNTLTVGLLTGASLAVALLLLRLQRQAANQVPVSALVVMAALASHHGTEAWQRAVDTVIGAGVGAAVSLALPVSRAVDARETFDRLGTALGDALGAMSAGLRDPWGAKQTAAWRRRARMARDRLVPDAKEAVGSGWRNARWNIRDRSHRAELSRYEEALPRLERVAIGVSSIARGLDDDASAAHGHDQLPGSGQLPPMPAMASLLGTLADLVRAFTGAVVGRGTAGSVDRAFQQVNVDREPCERAASRRARADDVAVDQPVIEWMTYATVLVQVDRIVEDLRDPLPP